jgi:PAS domain S-box-containing protein
MTAPRSTHAGERGSGLVSLVRRLASARRGAESDAVRQVSEAIVGALHDALVVFGPDGRIVRVNAQTCTITGFSESELIGASAPYPYWPVEHVDALRSRSAEVFRTGRGEFDVVLVRKSGERFPAIVTVGMTADGSRVALIKDVGERAKLVTETHAAREAF